MKNFPLEDEINTSINKDLKLFDAYAQKKKSWKNGLRIDYTIKSLSYSIVNEPAISMELYGFVNTDLSVFSSSGPCDLLRLEEDRGILPCLTLDLDPVAFKKFTGRDWDGTKEGAEKHKDLEGTIQSFYLKIEK